MKKNIIHMRLSMLVLCLLLAKGHAQEHLKIHFHPVFGNEVIAPGKEYCFGDGTKCVSITVMKWYVSNVRCYKNGKLVFKNNGSFLIDINIQTSLVRETNIPNAISFDEIRFYFGIDDVVNTEGVGDGDLDPVNGMYWTWQSGYINMKLEGTYRADATQAQSFEFHLGGFLKPYTSFQEISVHTATARDVSINADVRKFFEALNPDQFQSVMSPGEKAVQLSKKMASIFD